MRITRAALILIAPVLVVYAAFYLIPLLIVVQESFKEYVPGRIGGVGGTFTLANYLDLMKPAYFIYFLDTFRISLIATLLGLAVGYPFAYLIARSPAGPVRTACVAFLISMLFLSVIVRVYSLALTIGPIGILNPLANFLGVSPNSIMLIEVVVTAGLLHYVIPIAALTLVGTIQNINPALENAAQSLGAPRWKAFFGITVALSIRGIISAFLLGYAVSISAFVVPLILGKGIILFATNLIYRRFSEVANYPGGAAIAVIMLVLSLIIVYGIMRLVSRRFEVA